MHEAQLHERNSFITLTYDQEHLPADGGLVVEHWQEFVKRMRAWLDDHQPKEERTFRYYMAAEYGEKSLRPHYHACVFGQDFFEGPFGDPVWIKRNLYTSPCLVDKWRHGMVSVGHLTRQSAAYVARYAMKKQGGNRAEAHYTRVNPDTGECWQVRPEFSTMSRRPGLGAKWLEQFHADVYPSDEVVLDGQKHRPPRYYDDLFASKQSDPMWSVRLKSKRRRSAANHKEDQTPERLAVRQKVAVAHERQRNSRNVD